MGYVRERFRDPAAILPDYIFEVNHSDEEAVEQRRNLERTSPTSGVGFVRQQGADSPKTLRYTGTILTQTQYDAMQSYYDACRTRTIKFRDFTDDEMDVLITAFSPLRKRTIKNPRDNSISLHYWEYTIELEVIG
jgi:hypothetical protein